MPPSVEQVLTLRPVHLTLSLTLLAWAFIIAICRGKPDTDINVTTGELCEWGSWAQAQGRLRYQGLNPISWLPSFAPSLPNCHFPGLYQCAAIWQFTLGLLTSEKLRWAEWKKANTDWCLRGSWSGEETSHQCSESPQPCAHARGHSWEHWSQFLGAEACVILPGCTCAWAPGHTCTPPWGEMVNPVFPWVTTSRDRFLYERIQISALVQCTVGFS